MARSKGNGVVLLGYEDEFITEKHKSVMGYWINKVGGNPDWQMEEVLPSKCKLCGLPQPLVVQIYAPLEGSLFHRTLYVFACINPNCWNHNESWTCIRSQLLDRETSDKVTSEKTNVNVNTDWCAGSNDWNDNNGNYENGSTNQLVNEYSISDCESDGDDDDDDDDDDDSCSLSARIGNINVDDCNANLDQLEKSSGAVGKQALPSATAEIETEESEVVCIDTPTMPQKDLLALLQETAPLPYCYGAGERNQNEPVTFESFFISVGEEGTICNNSEHIRELIQEYQRNHGDIPHISKNQGNDERLVGSSEEYEKAIPAHGDKMFHHFLNRIQNNPGQILRYSRESESPLLFYPLQEYPPFCSHCNGETVFEMQLLPTLIPKLKIPNENEIRVEFGTVLIFTCKKSCWSLEDKYREERIIVQMERT